MSRRIREEFQNGDEYYAFQGTRLHLPDEKNDRPSDSFIEHHNTEIYVG